MKHTLLVFLERVCQWLRRELNMHPWDTELTDVTLTYDLGIRAIANGSGGAWVEPFDPGYGECGEPDIKVILFDSEQEAIRWVCQLEDEFRRHRLATMNEQEGKHVVLAHFSRLEPELPHER